MLSYWELYNFQYLNRDEIKKTADSAFDNDCEIIIEVDGEYYECQIGDLIKHDGKLVLEVIRD